VSGGIAPPFSTSSTVTKENKRRRFEPASELYLQSSCHLSAKLVPTFARKVLSYGQRN
jgi:hypothetical protein